MVFVVIALAGFAAVLIFRRQARAAVESVSVSTPPMPETIVKPPKGPYDALIASVARAVGFSPTTLKAIVAQESGFDRDAINPEKGFTLDGVRYSVGSKTGRTKLREYILAGRDLEKIGVRPSIGIAQLKLATARAYVPGVTAKELFDAQTNLTAAARFLKDLFRKGFTLETIDVYNRGETAFAKGERNLGYRDKVNAFARRFAEDFS